MSEVIRVTEPRELLAFIPYALGFAPTNSAVVVALRGERGRVGVIARVDLSDAPDAAAELAGVLVQDQATRAVVVTYTDDPQAARTATAALVEAAAARDLSAATWTVTSAGYRSPDCTDPDCCPPAGRPLTDLTGTQVAAALTVQGARVATDRDGLRVLPATGPGRTRALRAARDWLATHDPATIAGRRAALDAWRGALDSDNVPPAVLAVLSAAMTDALLRDAILCAVIPGTDPTLPDAVIASEKPEAVAEALDRLLSAQEGVKPGPDARAAASLLAAVAAHSAAARTPAPLTVAAILAWWSGDGARATVLVDQALTVDSTYRLALLMRQALTAALAPGWVRRDQ